MDTLRRLGSKLLSWSLTILAGYLVMVVINTTLALTGRAPLFTFWNLVGGVSGVVIGNLAMWIYGYARTLRAREIAKVNQ